MGLVDAEGHRALACQRALQFIKSDKWKVGEEKVAHKLGVDWVKGGDGFTWESPDLEKSEARAAAAWQLAATAIACGEYKLVVLDEVTYPMNWGWVDDDTVVNAIRDRPAHVNVIATGRDGPEALLAVADTATEMVKLRHVYDRGVGARRGIDF
jgi:cob(I)alamin adenosyltransferase